MTTTHVKVRSLRSFSQEYVEILAEKRNLNWFKFQMSLATIVQMSSPHFKSLAILLILLNLIAQFRLQENTMGCVQSKNKKRTVESMTSELWPFGREDI